MPRHPAGHRVNRVLDRRAPFLQGIRQFADGVLGLGHRQAVARDDHHPIRSLEHHRDLIGAGALHLAGVDVVGVHGRRRAQAAEQHADEGAVHRLAHDRREDQPRGSDERPGDHEHRVVDHEAGGGGGQARVAVEQADHDWHVGPADRHGERAAEQASRHHE